MNKTNSNNVQSDCKVKPNMFHLYWLNRHTKKKFSAGRAFYNEKTGDYQLLINILDSSNGGERRDEIFLKPANHSNDRTYFKVEKVMHKQQKVQRFSIGEGFYHQETEGDIHILIPPFTSNQCVLALSLSSNQLDSVAA